MPVTIKILLDQYTEILRKIYGSHLKTVILYGSYARGDYKADSDIDIMILLDLSDIDIKQYRHELSGETFDFNMDHDLDIKPIAKSQQHFQNWVDAMRARDMSIQNGPVQTGHLSSSLAHLGNISFRLGKQLQFDPVAERFIGDSENEANAMLSRDYRAPYVLPEIV